MTPDVSSADGAQGCGGGGRVGDQSGCSHRDHLHVQVSSDELPKGHIQQALFDGHCGELHEYPLRWQSDPPLRWVCLLEGHRWWKLKAHRGICLLGAGD